MSDLVKETASVQPEKERPPSAGEATAANDGANNSIREKEGSSEPDAAGNGDAADDGNDSSKKRGRDKPTGPYGHSKRKKKKEGGGDPSPEERQKQQGNKKAWRKNGRDDDDPSNLVPNLGSYAHPDMQGLFGVTVEKKTAGTADEKEKAPPPEKRATPKAPKKKVVLLVAFIGEAYSGMQINAGTKTVQGEMDFALYKSGYLSEANFGHPQKYSWSNSARTDKGVHACAQVCSLKIELPPSPDMDTVREGINRELPSDIRVLDVCRVTRTFCARTQRDRARYMYMLPSFLLDDRDKVRSLFEAGGCTANNCSAADPVTVEEMKALRPDVAKYRASSESIDRLRRCLASLEGTHTFHNFTSGKDFSDPSSKRYIESFKVLDPVVSDDGGMEWIPTLVLGQSFLLNQIRKMISLAVDAARGAAPMGALEDSMTGRRMLLGLAPAQGLFLDMSFFGQYNKKKQPEAPLDWVTKETPAVQRWREFRDQRILPHIMEEEMREGNFLKYLYQQEYLFDRKRYLPLDAAGQKQSAEKTTDEDDP